MPIVPAGHRAFLGVPVEVEKKTGTVLLRVCGKVPKPKQLMTGLPAHADDGRLKSKVYISICCQLVC